MRTTPTCSPLGPTRRTSGTRIRSFVLGSLMRCSFRQCSSCSPVIARRTRFAARARSRRSAGCSVARKEETPQHSAAKHPGYRMDARAAERRGATDPANLEMRSAGGISPLRFRGSGPGARIRLAEDAFVAEEYLEADALEEARDIADVPAVEVINTVAVHLLSAAAVKVGLADDPEHSARPGRGPQADRRARWTGHGRRPERRRPARPSVARRSSQSAARLPRGVAVPRPDRQGAGREVDRRSELSSLRIAVSSNSACA